MAMINREETSSTNNSSLLDISASLLPNFWMLVAIILVKIPIPIPISISILIPISIPMETATLPYRIMTNFETERRNQRYQKKLPFNYWVSNVVIGC